MILFNDLMVDPILSNDRSLILISFKGLDESIVLTHLQATLLSDRLQNVVQGYSDRSGGEKVTDQHGRDCSCGNGKLKGFGDYESPHYDNYFIKTGQKGVFCSSCQSYFPRYVVRLSTESKNDL